jgi:hypothetical protein
MRPWNSVGPLSRLSRFAFTVIGPDKRTVRFCNIIPAARRADWYARRVGVAAAREINEIPAARRPTNPPTPRATGISAHGNDLLAKIIHENYGMYVHAVVYPSYVGDDMNSTIPAQRHPLSGPASMTPHEEAGPIITLEPPVRFSFFLHSRDRPHMHECCGRRFKAPWTRVSKSGPGGTPLLPPRASPCPGRGRFGRRCHPGRP